MLETGFGESPLRSPARAGRLAAIVLILVPDVRDTPSVSGTAVRSQSRSALSLPEQDASRGVLVATVSNRDGLGFLAMVAQPGMGKTTLLFHLLQQLQPKARTAFIFHTQCTS